MSLHVGDWGSVSREVDRLVACGLIRVSGINGRTYNPCWISVLCKRGTGYSRKSEENQSSVA